MGTRLSRRLKLSHLSLMVAVAEKGSLLKAAGVLGLTQPALTRALHEMEVIVGARLFERHNKGVVATNSGERLLQTARRVLADLSECEHLIDQTLEGDEAVLSVGALSAAAAGVLPGTLARLRRQTPMMRIRIVQGQTDELLTALAAGEVDLIVGRLYLGGRTDNFERTILYDDIVTVLARADHPIFGAADDRLSLLHQYPLVLPARTPVVEIEQFLRRFDLQQSIYLEANSLLLIRELLLVSDAVTIVPSMMLAGDLQRGTLREITALPAPGGRPCGLIQRRDMKPSAPALQFAAALREQVQAMGAAAHPA